MIKRKIRRNKTWNLINVQDVVTFTYQKETFVLNVTNLAMDNDVVNYIQENGLDGGINIISGKTGISVKNINRFLGYEGLGEYSDKLGNISLKSDKIDL